MGGLTRLDPLSHGLCHSLLLEQELEEERKKLYRAIGYSEKGKVSDYPKQVHVCMCCDDLLPGDDCAMHTCTYM